MRSGSAMALCLVALMMASGLATAQPEDVDGAPVTQPGEHIDYTAETIEIVNDVEAGEINLLLGEAKMQVDYGDGRISLETTQKKYMGIADVYDDRRGFSHRVGIPTYSVFYQRLVGVGEYVDANDNGLFDVHGPRVAGTIEELEESEVSHEELLKWVDFADVEWQLTSFTQSVNGNEISIDFILSASEVPYSTESGTLMDASVAAISYIFHVTTVEEQIEVEAVPHYRVFGDGEAEVGQQIASSNLIAETDVTGEVLNSTWKYDQDIRGWDVAVGADGTTRNDTRLVVLTEVAYGAHIDDTVAEWMKDQNGGMVAPMAVAGHAPPPLPPNHMPGVQGMDSMGQDGDAPPPMAAHDGRGHPLDCGLAYVGDAAMMANSGHTEARSSEMDDDGSSAGGRADNNSTSGESPKSEDEKRRDAVHERMKQYRDIACMQRGQVMEMTSESRPEVIRAGAIHFDDNGADIGRLRWVSNATVDGVETEVLFQIHGARPVIQQDVDDRDGLWAGVRIVGGYNYVIGDSVYHDPEFSTDVLTINTESFGEPFIYSDGNLALLIQRLIRILPLALGIVVISLDGIVGVSNRNRRKQAPLPSPPQYVPAGAWTSGDDWSQYQP